jgi:carboxyl-terminal processing protease
LSNGGGVRISIARWYTPEGRSIDLVGITPDYMVEFPPLAEDEEYSRDTDPQLQAALEFLEAGEITTIPLFEPTPEPAE